jgi:hypothetical protein
MDGLPLHAERVTAGEHPGQLQPIELHCWHVRFVGVPVHDETDASVLPLLPPVLPLLPPKPLLDAPLLVPKPLLLAPPSSEPPGGVSPGP